MFQLFASLLPGTIAWGCCLGREMNRIPHALAMQAKKIQHSQPEEVAMLAILFLKQKDVGIAGNRRSPDVVAMMGKVEISSSAFENDDCPSLWRPRPLELEECFSFSCH